MSIRNRFIVALVSAFAVLALPSASASAAGKPVVKTTQNGNQNISGVTVSGTVNPNGAATTYKFEYGLYGSGSYPWSTTVESAGSSFQDVPVSATLQGLFPATRYSYRINATNSYGSVTSESYWGETNEWIETKGVEFPAPVASEGTFSIEFTNWGTSIKCNESGTGTVGTPQGVEDVHNVYLSGCALYFGAEKHCDIPNTGFQLAGNFVGGYLEIELPGCNWLAEEIELKVGAMTPSESGSYLVYQPIGLTKSTSFGGQPVKLSGSTTWHYTGSSEGAKLRWE